ncbi:uncharacterized protein LOC144704628 [Wolffia australiana]
MEYKRIHGVQAGVISPSKLRMKLLGVHSHWTTCPDLQHSTGVDEADEGDKGRFLLKNSQRTVLAGKRAADDAVFEFSGGAAAPPFPRPFPSKWNDAEKWISIRHVATPDHFKKPLPDDPPPLSSGKVVPEAVDVDPTPPAADALAKPVSMRDTGTEMTPAASHEPSRTATPNRPSSPNRPPPILTVDSPEMTEDERRMKTRSEIFTLGVQLGKMNIAAWASKIEFDRVDEAQTQDQTVDFSARAAAWAAAEKAEHNARFKREEAQIEAWEEHEKAKVEARMREVEARAEKMKAQAHERALRELAEVKLRAEDKLAAAEARRERHVVAVGRQAEHIRRTGQCPPPPGCRRLCGLWFW